MNRTLFAALLAVAAIAFLFRLGYPDFWGNHWESRRALIARTMVESGDYLVPRQNGAITLNKPPLYYWVMAASMQLTGDDGEFGARLPSALAGLFGIALAARLAWLLAGPAAALWAGALLVGNVLWLGHARTAEMDLLLAVVELAAVVAFLEARRRGPRSVLPWLGWAALAAGFLMKGPVGLLVPAAVTIAFRVADARGGPEAPRGWLRPRSGLLLFLLLVAPWFAVVLAKVPDAVDIFRRETLTRYSGGLDHHEPFWFYGPVVIAGFLPGSQFWPLWVRAARRGRTPQERNLRLLGLSVVALLVFFSFSGSKRVYYLLPLWPLLAAGTALTLEWARREGRTGWLRRGNALLAGVLGCAAAAALLIPHVGGPPFYETSALAWSFLVTTAALCFWGAREALAGAWERGLLATVAGVVLVGLFLVQSVGPVSNAYRSRRGFAEEAARRVGGEKPLYAFRESNFAYPFYARRDIPGLRDEESLNAVLERHGVIQLILGEGNRRRLAEAGYALEETLARSWAPPGRPEDVRTLYVVRISAPPPDPR